MVSAALGEVLRTLAEAWRMRAALLSIFGRAGTDALARDEVVGELADHLPLRQSAGSRHGESPLRSSN